MLVTCVLSLIVMYWTAYDRILDSGTFFDPDAPDLKDNPEVVKSLYEEGHNKYNIWDHTLYHLGLLFPLIVVFPYAASFLEDRSHKFYYFIQMRKSADQYVLGKYLVVTVVGGLAIFVPQIIFYAVLSIVFKNEADSPYRILKDEGLFYTLFNTSPEAYIWLTFLTHFLLGACFAAMALCLSSFVKKKAVVYIAPFLIFAAWEITVGAILGLYQFSPTTWYQMWPEVHPLYVYGSMATILIACCLLFVWQSKRVRVNG